MIAVSMYHKTAMLMYSPNQAHIASILRLRVNRVRFRVRVNRVRVNRGDSHRGEEWGSTAWPNDRLSQLALTARVFPKMK